MKISTITFAIIHRQKLNNGGKITAKFVVWILLEGICYFHITWLFTSPNRKKFACDQCDFKTKLAKSLTTHKKRKHEQIREEVCHICGKTFFDKYNLSQHLNIMHTEGEKEFVCEKCGATYTTMMSLKGHVREKHPVYYLCSYCDKKMFLSQKKLRVHLLNAHNAKCGTKDFYVCPKCQKCCTSFRELDEHLSSEHEMKKDKHQCQLCNDKHFASSLTLKMHFEDGPHLSGPGLLLDYHPPGPYIVIIHASEREHAKLCLPHYL